MLVQFNSGHHVNGTVALATRAETSLRHALGSFADQITRVEIHVSDDNSTQKGGIRDKSCRIEARLSGRQPIAVEADGDTVIQSVESAAEKLRRAVQTIVGRDNNH